MLTAKTAPDIIAAIQAAPASERAEEVAARLGVSRRTVFTYRRQVRDMRQEAAREAIAEHVEATVPNVLADLDELRGLAADHYRKTGNPRHGTLWLNAVRTTLEHVTPSDTDIDAEIDRELARLASAGEAPDAGAAPRTLGNGRG